MKRLLQKSIAFMLASFIVCVLLPSVGVLAEDKGDEYFYFYNFEDYTGGIPEGFSDKFFAGNANCLSAYEDAERGKVMKQLNNTDKVLFFGQMFTTGNLHISFDYKMEGEGFKILPKLFDSMDSDGTDTTIVASQYYSKIAKIDRLTDTSVDELSVYSGNGHSWGYQTTEPYKLDGEAWHRVDIVMNDLGKSTTGMDLYIDGVKYTNDKVLVPWGVKAFSIRTEGISGVTAKNAALYLDNISVRRTYKDNQLFVDNVGKKRLDLENGKLNIALSEPVNKEKITADDITIKNKLTGQEITNYSVTNSLNTGFDIEFSGNVTPGKYTLSISENIKGVISGYHQTEALEFSTASRTQKINIDYADINFNSYTAENGALPSGFVEREGNTYIASAALGSSAQSNDKALGFENIVYDSDMSKFRYIYALENTVKSGSEFNVSFDVKSNDMLTWYIMLLEKDDLNTDTNDYRESVAIGTNDRSTGSMGYASKRNNGVDKSFENLIATPNEWNKINLRVVPKENEKTEYYLSINNGQESNAEVSRAFDTKDVAGIGLGYTLSRFASNEQPANVFFDNIKITQKIDVVYPEVNDIKLYDCYNQLIEGGSSTSMIRKAVVEFDSLADEASAASKLTITNGDKEIIPNISCEDIDGKTYMTAEFPELAEGNSSVTIYMAKGVKSALSSSIYSELDYTYTIKTNADSGVKIISRGINEGNYDLIIAKNNDKTAEYTIALCGYKDVVVDAESGKKVPHLVGMTYFPISFTENDKGVYSYSKPISLLGEYEYTKELVFSYPTSRLINVAEDGMIN